MTADALWQAFAAACPDAPATHEAWAFGAEPDALARLVLAGRKTATRLRLSPLRPARGAPPAGGRLRRAPGRLGGGGVRAAHHPGVCGPPFGRSRRSMPSRRARATAPWQAGGRCMKPSSPGRWSGRADLHGGDARGLRGIRSGLPPVNPPSPPLPKAAPPCYNACKKCDEGRKRRRRPFRERATGGRRAGGRGASRPGAAANPRRLVPVKGRAMSEGGFSSALSRVVPRRFSLRPCKNMQRRGFFSAPPPRRRLFPMAKEKKQEFVTHITPRSEDFSQCIPT